MTSWRVGRFTVHKVVEFMAPMPVAGVLRTSDPGLLAGYTWPSPAYAAPDGTCVLSFHSLVVDTGDRHIVVDTCVGNDRATIPRMPVLSTGWFEQLEKIVPAADVDSVVCTHLHFDHVGWHTRLVDGAWRPTFPRARHVIPSLEWEHVTWHGDRPGYADLTDTIRPVVDAGLADLVAGDHQLCPGVRLEPAPGHTPGQVAVVLESEGERAVITGDVAHHPVQFVRPDVASAVDDDPARAEATRRAFVERYADTGTLVIGTHFPDPTAGLLTRDADGRVRFVAA